ncbi:hypothetical protein GGS24DRAFT_414324 [Hypoxylon argillaceum]|nr:hypothetical protein GGS24DRAFT_414324 [Hypoxylon argillaceum]KAI1156714.1 hypothetical protein F4825DRAFT_215048 [Nemania diffusa]
MPIPIFLSPALPSELLSYILNHHVHPTTLIICSSHAEFLTSVVEDIRRQSCKSTQNLDQQDPHESELSHHQCPEEESAEVKHALLSSPLSQVATSRHIRVIYVPTVTHLRAHLSVFSPDESRVPIPPARTLIGDNAPHIILYGFLKLHRDTSEWSAQGLSNTASTLVELVYRLAWNAILIEPRNDSCDAALEDLLQETVPILNGGARSLGPGSEEGAWTGRTVEVGRILGRWSRFQKAQWDISDQVVQV